MPAAQAGRKSLEARVRERVARVEVLQPTWPTCPQEMKRKQPQQPWQRVPVSKKSAGKFHSIGAGTFVKP